LLLPEFLAFDITALLFLPNSVSLLLHHNQHFSFFQSTGASIHFTLRKKQITITTHGA